jgi:hypothetical protein
MFYIGMHSTRTLEDSYLGSGLRLGNSIRKYGKSSHVREILEFLPTREALRLREREIVNKEMLSEPMCMNLMIGGDGEFSSVACKKGAEAVQKMRENHPTWRKSLGKSAEKRFQAGFNPMHSENAKSKLRIRMSRPVLQYDFEGKLVRKWDRIGGIAQALGNSSHQHLITKCCQGKITEAMGFRWQYDTQN